MITTVFKPIRDDQGVVQLYDIYFRGEFVGSRRTIEQCEAVCAWRALHSYEGAESGRSPPKP
jgi:hypothetical protein